MSGIMLASSGILSSKQHSGFYGPAPSLYSLSASAYNVQVTLPANGLLIYTFCGIVQTGYGFSISNVIFGNSTRPFTQRYGTGSVAGTGGNYDFILYYYVNKTGSSITGYISRTLSLPTNNSLAESWQVFTGVNPSNPFYTSSTSTSGSYTGISGNFGYPSISLSNIPAYTTPIVYFAGKSGLNAKAITGWTSTASSAGSYSGYTCSQMGFYKQYTTATSSDAATMTTQVGTTATPTFYAWDILQPAS